ncbi:hypothetical protein CLMAG_37840 [Clostridium magnum DSM 2767]|uniref:Uncharacterized protein n=1 Tax=Clostridium magnum DSM 2767 TaxID=1121326 RepID=A0A162S7E4_9CLOT|nr:hypothetical protein CLMAG_37840 [Clostridium magnum DSM 2767]
MICFFIKFSMIISKKKKILECRGAHCDNIILVKINIH